MKKASKTVLVAVIEKVVAEEPFAFDGHKWAAKSNSFYCEAMGLSDATFRRMTRTAPFVKLRKLVQGKQTCLLRIGEPGPKSVHETAKVLRGIWRHKVGMKKPETEAEAEKWEHQKRCLWGFAKEVMALPSLKDLDDPSEFTIAAFKGALDNWQETATACRLAAEAIPDYVLRFRDFPNIPTMCRFHKAVAYVHIGRLMEKGKIPQEKLKAAGDLYALTDPFLNHPGSTLTKEDLINAKPFPPKTPWKPKQYPGEFDKAKTMKEVLLTASAKYDPSDGEQPPF